jgi:hypothetical protein
MTGIKRGDPPGLANVRSNIYHHYIRVDKVNHLADPGLLIEFHAIAAIA